MLKFLIKRLMLGIVVMLGVVTITFVLVHILPSDPAAKWAGARATPEQIAQAKIELGLDKPLAEQYIKYLGDLLHFDFGKSLRTHQPVKNELANYLPATLELVFCSTILAILIGLPMGILSAKNKDKLGDHISRFISIGAVSLPTFWIGIFAQLIFYSWLSALPIGGQLSQETKIFYNIPDITGFLIFDSVITGNWVIAGDALKHILLPCVTISLYPIGLVARMTRSAMLEILNEDYITAERSYGLNERKIHWRYALKNSLGSTATVVTLSIGYTLVNTFLVEAIFDWPGIGTYISTAVTTLDYPAVMGVTLFSACSYVVLNLIADIIIAVDPRIRI
ncbi:MAG: ABC transporter permease [Clostridiaceae bacterium]|nr:ABC transporter permease [Eubacteriales bacterium]